MRGPTSAAVTAGCAVTKPSASWISVSPASSATAASFSTASSRARLAGSAVSKRSGSTADRCVAASRPARTAPDSHPEASGLHTSTPSPYCSVTGSTWLSIPRCRRE
ncbi:hypothetical protein B0E38_03079 [Streptomyces sp. 111WW2]|nr:hypothetical protein B0E38_03079 [Streptomyces sp. 111WW2]